MLLAFILQLFADNVAGRGAEYSEWHNGYSVDPIASYRPPFPRSLPVQILLTGVVFTLVLILLLHLIFTAQYHWSLAPINYVLQLSGVVTLTISLIATLHVVLSTTKSESQSWPYMISYLAVDVPPYIFDEEGGTSEWTFAERATWLIMNATTSALAKITHIQLLTLLFPTTLERRLILCCMGPLALLAAISQLLPISPSLTVLASATRNICTTSLSILFTLSLLIYAFITNPRNAWRTDGGTAVFGFSALVLSLASTSLSLLFILKEGEYVWLPGLTWAVIHWQSFLGWWWWVGSARGERERERERNRHRHRAEETQTVSSGRRRTRNGDEDSSLRQRRSQPQPGLDSEVEEDTAQRDRASRFPSIQSWYPSVTLPSFTSLRTAPQAPVEIELQERNRPDDEQPTPSASTSNLPVKRPSPPREYPSRGMLWMGPIGRWRLRNSTVYS